jgi:enoyl-CoA hydratase
MSASADPGPGSPVLLSERRGSVVLLTLNRPHKLNALNQALQAQATAALRGLAQDGGVRCVIVTGAGRGFCAGLDLSDFAASLAAAAIASAEPGAAAGERRAWNVFEALDALPMPVIGAVNGAAYTGGFELALCCDLLIAAPEARFGDTHAAVGVMPGAGLSQKLSRIVGLPRAMAVSLAGQAMSGAEAYRCGLVSHLVPREELLPLAWKLAQAIAAYDPQIAADLKRLMKAGAALPLGEALALEKEAHRRWAAGARLEDLQAHAVEVLHGSRASGIAGEQVHPPRQPRPSSAEPS